MLAYSKILDLELFVSLLPCLGFSEKKKKGFITANNC